MVGNSFNVKTTIIRNNKPNLQRQPQTKNVKIEEGNERLKNGLNTLNLYKPTFSSEFRGEPDFDWNSYILFDYTDRIPEEYYQKNITTNFGSVVNKLENYNNINYQTELFNNNNDFNNLPNNNKNFTLKKFAKNEDDNRIIDLSFYLFYVNKLLIEIYGQTKFNENNLLDRFTNYVNKFCSQFNLIQTKIINMINIINIKINEVKKLKKNFENENIEKTPIEIKKYIRKIYLIKNRIIKVLVDIIIQTKKHNRYAFIIHEFKNNMRIIKDKLKFVEFITETKQNTNGNSYPTKTILLPYDKIKNINGLNLTNKQTIEGQGKHIIQEKKITEYINEVVNQINKKRYCFNRKKVISELRKLNGTVIDYKEYKRYFNIHVKISYTSPVNEVSINGYTENSVETLVNKIAGQDLEGVHDIPNGIDDDTSKPTVELSNKPTVKLSNIFFIIKPLNDLIEASAPIFISLKVPKKGMFKDLCDCLREILKKYSYTGEKDISEITNVLDKNINDMLSKSYEKYKQTNPRTTKTEEAFKEEMKKQYNSKQKQSNINDRVAILENVRALMKLIGCDEKNENYINLLYHNKTNSTSKKSSPNSSKSTSKNYSPIGSVISFSSSSESNNRSGNTTYSFVDNPTNSNKSPIQNNTNNVNEISNKKSKIFYLIFSPALILNPLSTNSLMPFFELFSNCFHIFGSEI